MSRPVALRICFSALMAASLSRPPVSGLKRGAPTQHQMFGEMEVFLWKGERDTGRKVGAGLPEVQKRKRPSGHLNPSLITPAAGIPLFPLGIKLVLKLWQLLGIARVILLGLGELSRGYPGVISLALFPHFRVSRIFVQMEGSRSLVPTHLATSPHLDWGEATLILPLTS